MSNNLAGFVVPQTDDWNRVVLATENFVVSQTEDWNGVVLATENRFVVPQTEDWDEEIRQYEAGMFVDNACLLIRFVCQILNFVNKMMPKFHIFFVHVSNGNVRLSKHALNAIKNSGVKYRVVHCTRVFK